MAAAGMGFAEETTTLQKDVLAGSPKHTVISARILIGKDGMIWHFRNQ